MPIIDISGRIFGRLTVVKMIESKNRNMYWLCRCECGREVEVCGRSLRRGRTKSCGCLQRELVSERFSVPIPRNSEKLYHIWKGMRKRCRGGDDIHKKYYTSRGIMVCNEWDDYLNFKEWALSHGYEDGLTIDRIDNFKGYNPDNCRWIPMFEQASNKRNNRWITVNGETKTLAQWAQTLGFCPAAVHAGLRRNGVKYLEQRIAN